MTGIGGIDGKTGSDGIDSMTGISKTGNDGEQETTA
jgi:hypothetical protein